MTLKGNISVQDNHNNQSYHKKKEIGNKKYIDRVKSKNKSW